MKEKEITHKILKPNKKTKINKVKCRRIQPIEEIEEQDEIEEMEYQAEKQNRWQLAEEDIIEEDDDYVEGKCKIRQKDELLNKKYQDEAYQIDQEEKNTKQLDQINELVIQKVSPSLEFQLLFNSRKIRKQSQEINRENIIEGKQAAKQNDEEKNQTNSEDKEDLKQLLDNNITGRQLQLQIDSTITENINNIKQKLSHLKEGKDDSYEKEDQDSSIEGNTNENDIVQQILGDSMNDSIQTHFSPFTYLNKNPQSQILTYSIQRNNNDHFTQEQENTNNQHDLHLLVQDEDEEEIISDDDEDELINIAFFENNNTQTQPSQIVGISQVNIIEQLQVDTDENYINRPHSPAYSGIDDGEEEEENEEDGPPFGWEHWFDNDDDEGYFGWINHDTSLNFFLFSNSKEDHIRGR